MTFVGLSVYITESHLTLMAYNLLFGESVVSIHCFMNIENEKQFNETGLCHSKRNVFIS